MAFTIVTHDQLGLFEVLLHTIFRPYNSYCIYIGSNTAENYRRSVEKLVNCYSFLYPGSNVFMAVNTTAVKWARWSVIEADLICMEQLLNLKSQYTYSRLLKKDYQNYLWMPKFSRSKMSFCTLTGHNGYGRYKNYLHQTVCIKPGYKLVV